MITREKDKDRKERTRKTIQIVTLFESYTGVESAQEAESWLKEYKQKNKLTDMN